MDMHYPSKNHSGSAHLNIVQDRKFLAVKSCDSSALLVEDISTVRIVDILSDLHCAEVFIQTIGIVT